MLIIQQVIAFIPFAIPMTNFDISYALSMRIRIHTNHENKRPIYNQKPNALPWRQCKASRNSSNACFFPKAGWQCLQYRLTPKTHTYVPKLWKNHTWTFIHMGWISPGKHEKFSHECTAQLHTFWYAMTSKVGFKVYTLQWFWCAQACCLWPPYSTICTNLTTCSVHKSLMEFYL